MSPEPRTEAGRELHQYVMQRRAGVGDWPGFFREAYGWHEARERILGGILAIEDEAERRLTVERVWQTINEWAARYGWSKIDSVKLRAILDEVAAVPPSKKVGA